MTFDAQIQSITQDYIVPKVTDQTLQSNVLPLIFLANGRPWMGESFKFPVKLSNHTQGGSFNDFQEFQVSNENVRQTASFDARAYYQSVTIGGIARSVNAISKTQLLNLVKVEMESANQDMASNIGTLFYSDGTGNGSADFLGLIAGVDDGTNVATYGGLSRSTYTKWASVIQTSVGAHDFTKTRTLMNSATTGGMKPNLLVCDETTFGYVESDYAASVEGNYNLIEANRANLTSKGIMPKTRDGLVGNAGFDTLYYGGSPIIKDEKCGTQALWALNTEYLRWYGVTAAEASPVDLSSVYHDGNDYDKVPTSIGFSWTGFVRPSKQYAFIGQFLVLGNLINHAPRLSSVSKGITS